MTASLASPPRGVPGPPAAAGPRTPSTRLAPTLVAALLAAVYVIVDPPSVDLAAHLFRAHLFAQEGFGIWNNEWYGGHNTPSYSVLFPAVSAALSPQVAGALAATATAAVFEPMARRHFGPPGWLGAVVFGAATAIDLYTGRLALAFGALPALAAIAALDRERIGWASLLAAVSALCSPVAALFAALAAAGVAAGRLIGERRLAAVLPGAAVAAAALVPVGALAIAFPEGGTEPFAPSSLIPLLVIVVAGLVLVPARRARLRAGIAVYGLAVLAAYLVPSPVGSNIARLGTLLAAPLAALLLWPRRARLLALVALPLLYVGWQAPVLDVAATASDPAVSAAYYRPLLAFLRAQPGVFRTEIPLTRSHWEANWVARSFPIARGWERQLDIADNAVFYSGRLTAASYRAWLDRNAVRFVALPDAALDASAQREAALIRAGLPYLRPVMRSAHWRVYAVTDATPLATGAATATAMGPSWVALRARSAGSAVVRVHFSPYWALAGASGCVAPDGSATRVQLRAPGTVRLVIRFALARVAARSPRCTGPA